MYMQYTRKYDYIINANKLIYNVRVNKYNHHIFYILLIRNIKYNLHTSSISIGRQNDCLTFIQYFCFTMQSYLFKLSSGYEF